jgi:competence protein ComEC
MSAARAFARRAIAQSVAPWDPRSAAIVAAIVIGERAGLTQDVQRRLQEAGTYHVIAISGGNIAILAGLLLAMCRVAGWLGRGAMIAAIAALLAYARLVGDSASVDRATLMAAVYFGARAVDQRSPPLNALAVVSAVSHRRRSVVGGGPGIHPDVRRHPRDSDRRAGYHDGSSSGHEEP